MTPAASPQKKMAGLTLNHFGIYVKDMDESVKFYTEKMGFREAFPFKDSGRCRSFISRSITTRSWK